MLLSTVTILQWFTVYFMIRQLEFKVPFWQKVVLYIPIVGIIYFIHDNFIP